MDATGFEIRLGNPSRHRPRRLELTALTDLVFILLLFFILETRFVAFHQLDFRQPQERQRTEVAGAGDAAEGQPDPQPPSDCRCLPTGASGWPATSSPWGVRNLSSATESSPGNPGRSCSGGDGLTQLLVSALDALHGARLDRVLVRQFDPDHD